MKATRVVGFITSVLTLTYGLFLVLILLVTWGRYPTAIDISPVGLEVVDMIVYLIFGVNMLRNKSEFFVLAIYWTIFSVTVASFAVTYRTTFLNFFSFLIIFFGTLYYVTVTNPTIAAAKRLGWWSGILALIHGIVVALATVFTYFSRLNGWGIPVPLHLGINRLAPPPGVGIFTAVVYLVVGIGILRSMRKEFFLLAILWTLLESALALINSAFLLSHFYIFSLLTLTFATYYYFAKTRN